MNFTDFADSTGNDYPNKGGKLPMMDWKCDTKYVSKIH